MWSSNPKFIYKKTSRGVGFKAPNFEKNFFLKSILGIGCVYSEELVSFGLVV